MRRPKPQNDVYAAIGPIRSWIWGLLFIFGFGLAVWMNIWLFNGPLPERSPFGQVIGRLALLMFLVMIGDTALGFILRIGFNHPWRLVGPLMCRCLDFMNSLGKKPSNDTPPKRHSETRDAWPRLETTPSSAAHYKERTLQQHVQLIMRSLPRIVMLIPLFALLGATTTVAVAWGIAVRGVAAHDLRESTDQTPVALADLNRNNVLICWPAVSGPGWTWTTTVLMPINSISTDGRYVEPYGYIIDDHGPWMIERIHEIPRDRQLPFEGRSKHQELRFGWPFICMWAVDQGDGLFDFNNSFGWSSVLHIKKAKNQTRQSGLAKPFIRKKDSLHPPADIAVPLGILPRGLALNTAFYAAVWWVLLIGLGRTRAWNRRRRKRCTKCKYDLRGLEPDKPCPECGKIRT